MAYLRAVELEILLCAFRVVCYENNCNITLSLFYTLVIKSLLYVDKFVSIVLIPPFVVVACVSNYYCCYAIWQRYMATYIHNLTHTM